MNIYTRELVPFKELANGQTFYPKDDCENLCLKVISPIESEINCVDLSINWAFDFDEEEEVIPVAADIIVYSSSEDEYTEEEEEEE